MDSRDRGVSCYLAPIIDRILARRVNGHGLRKCDGQLDPHHCVEQQRIKKAWPFGVYWVGSRWERISRGQYSESDMRRWTVRWLDDLLADRRNIVPVCRRHHDLLTSHAIRLSREDYPPSVHEFAADYSFYFDERQGWVAAAEVSA